ncbi:hypothetical protein [Enhygromyxa salina]|uniref:hypothetical protein n=1 Tax=Enhygromyxa salina TaxID=215803 RepID=UPI000D03812D|nr:hypothetical protein [Enhygromyxa salina]
MSLPPAPSPGPSLEIDEVEHQALDLLDELRCGAAWIAAQRAQDEVLPEPPADPQADPQAPFDDRDRGHGATALAAAIVEAGEDPGRVAAAEPIAAALLMRLVTEVAASLVDAAHALAQSESRGDLTPGELSEVAALLNERPTLSPAIAPAVETTGVVLGLDRASIAWAMLISLGERADIAAPPQLRACSTAIADRLQAAHPSGSTLGSSSIPTPLRVFRSAAVIAAGPSVRARVLAADHPELLALAGRLVETHSDPVELVGAFDAARTALADASRERAAPTEPAAERPKRRFTVVHLSLALIVLGLTLWHYLWR